MSWLYGQTWLWYLIAFLVGVLLAWLFLVLPQQRRLRALDEKLSTGPAADAPGAESTPEPVAAVAVPAAVDEPEPPTEVITPHVDDAVTEQFLPVDEAVTEKFPPVDPALSSLDDAAALNDPDTDPGSDLPGASADTAVVVAAAAPVVMAKTGAGGGDGGDAPASEGDGPAGEGDAPAGRGDGPAGEGDVPAGDADKAADAGYTAADGGDAAVAPQGFAATGLADEKSADQQPADPESAVGESAAEEPVAEEPAAGGSAVDEPAFVAGPYPGSALPAADGSAPTEAFTIKGNTDSGLYHTPTSPYYTRTKAEAWFATAEEAEAAGFIAWKRR